MKTKFTRATVFVLCIAFLLSLCSCGPQDGGEDPWSDAIYTEDTELGEGEKTVTVEVTVGENRVRFTVHTNASTLGDALIENGLVEGEDSQYGLYVKKVNGILADYDVNGAYWGFYRGGEYMMSGIDTTEIVGGEAFELVYEK